MLKRWEFWTLTVGAGLGLALVMLDMWLVLGNRTSQLEVNNRQQFIQQSAQLEGLSREIVRALADLSIKNKDEELRNLLASQGIAVNLSPQGAPKSEDESARKNPK